jgi:hypothetical protein
VAAPLVLAHHGDVNPLDGYPENTAEAIAQAAARGAWGVEFDVQRSSQGTWYLMHDKAVDRTTDGTGRLNDKTDAEIDALHIDGGMGYNAVRHGTNLHVPTLERAMQRVGSIHLSFDLKDAEDASHRAIAQWVCDHGLAQRASIIVKSLTGAAIIRATCPGVTIIGQPDWIKQGLYTSADIDLVLVWGDQLLTALKYRPPSQIALFRHPIFEAGISVASTWLLARAARVAWYFSDDLRASISTAERP